MDFQLTDQQRSMIATVRDLAQGEFKANALRYMDGTFPWDNMKKLARIGVLGMSVPEQYAGLACRYSTPR
jgi:alkylation response protein AidB-like acyl-CoA dehydrogenase